MTDHLSETFNIEESNLERDDNPGGEVVLTLNKADELEPGESEIDKDFDSARHTIYDLIEISKDAIGDAVKVAKASEEPRAFEVLSNMIQQLSSMNKDLLDLHEKKAKISGKLQPNGPSNVTNNAVFVGTTAELSKLLFDNGNK